MLRKGRDSGRHTFAIGDAGLRTIAVVTTSRADYGIVRPILRAIDSDPNLRLRLIVGGTHLAPDFGHTVAGIERDGFTVHERVEMLLASDSPLGIAKSMGLGTLSYAECYARRRPDIVVVTGDRFEMHAAALAALPFKIPVAHIHGGELTAGAIDDALRHSMTKLSHLHFTATEDARSRVIGMGEEPWRVTLSGAPALDDVVRLPRLEPAALMRELKVNIAAPALLVTFHPVTLQYEQTAAQIDELLGALDTVSMPVIFTLPNADTSGRTIRDRVFGYAAAHERAWVCDNLGSQTYFSLLGVAAAMVGNSSSGIIEAASFRLPVVNIGERQSGRLRARNVIDATPERTAIAAAIRRAMSPGFRSSLTGLVNPYGRGNAAAAIVSRLRDVELDDDLLLKRFHHPADDRAQYA